MKNILEIVVAVVVIILLVGAMFFVKPSNVVVEELDNSGDVVVDEKSEVVPFEEISAEYSMAIAIKEGTFVVDNKGKLYNKVALEDFFKVVRNNQNGYLRIVQEEMSGDIQVTEVEITQETIVVKYRGVNSSINQNEYLKSDGYSINSTTKLTNDGSWWNGCYIVKDESEEIILFGYTVKNTETSGENLPQSGDVE